MLFDKFNIVIPKDDAACSSVVLQVKIDNSSIVSVFSGKCSFGVDGGDGTGDGVFFVGLQVLYGGLCLCVSSVFIEESYEVFVNESIPVFVKMVDFLEKLVFGHDVGEGAVQFVWC